MAVMLDDRGSGCNGLFHTEGNTGGCTDAGWRAMP
jgi:hypothetical protein